ncbi:MULTISPECIES: phosphatidylglycerol lysyltransferase domain-containing protein [unclassified Streptomyces]|uniref:phosphatidylglycerol lysyltransferase domain-containing protein n=1 Tax=unclassified Streptomyces TaxID=2593676 RepID=UPI002E80BC19|nr:phosphatidylglycerol lysyltransferase domain-containing protein [Streptomyces sp. NBC_00589]WTI42897.1 phosphatidylglycerol lysyltransferase domain-containing protein [Streptomyces sp. NBC_00775]WUB32890.1 phosphatidylglycerol lysyltransferase domain-containing protein [Streptomyces sp. NBC_00589]
MRLRAAAFTVWYLRLLALLNIVAVVSLPFREEVHEHNGGEFFTPYLATAGLISAALALFLALVMRRRKRAAWIFNVLLAGPLFALYVVALTQERYQRHGFNWISALLTGLFVAALLLGRTEFHAVGDRSNPRLALAVGAGGLLVSATLGTLLVSATNRVSGTPLSDRIAYTLLRGVSVGPLADRFDSVVAPRWVDVLVNALIAATFLLVLYACFRAPRGRELLGEEDESRLRELLDRHGERDSLGYFALRRDKAVMWSPSGKAAIAYRVVGGVTLASGDPIGDPEAWPGAIEEWLKEARRHAWTPAVMGASEEAGTIYARHGLDALELGDEAIVDRADFTLEGRAMRGVRQAHNRVRRAGYTVRVRRHADIPEAEMAALTDKADHWRDGETERGFSMALGRLGDPADGRCVMLECHDGEGEPRAVLSFVPWGERGLSLDLMRRDRNSENGLMEFMVIELLLRAQEIGVERVSLNFAMFRSVFERGTRLGAGPVLRLWCSVLTFLSRWWQLESLYRANAKYRPVWEPRYILFEKSSDIPRIGMAAARAEGFLTPPALPRRGFSARRPRPPRQSEARSAPRLSGQPPAPLAVPATRGSRPSSPSPRS